MPGEHPSVSFRVLFILFIVLRFGYYKLIMECNNGVIRITICIKLTDFWFYQIQHCKKKCTFVPSKNNHFSYEYIL